MKGSGARIQPPTRMKVGSRLHVPLQKGIIYKAIALTLKTRHNMNEIADLWVKIVDTARRV